jgi:sugar lactone lactonase YvrE
MAISGLGGLAAQGGLSAICGVAVSTAGDVYVSTDDYAVLVVTAADGFVNLAYGQRHFAADGTFAHNAALDRFTQALAADSQGNLYIGDGNTVRRIDRYRVLSTIAGQERTGTEATNVVVNAGDGGPATAARIQNPVNAIAVDPAGNVYFSAGGGEDPLSATVRRVGTDGIINTVGGGGDLSGAINGLAVDSSGSLYISDTGHHRIRKVTPEGVISTIAGTGTGGVTTGDGGPATQADIQQPQGLAFDAAGNLYFADYAANRVRKIAPDGIISTFAGTGIGEESGDGGPAAQASLNGPSSLAINPDGRVYIADYSGNALRVVMPNGIIHTIARGQPEDIWDWICSYGGDGGPATSAHYSNIAAVALDAGGNIYVMDEWNERIRILMLTHNRRRAYE